MLIFQFYLTPGGHLCILIDTRGYLITGGLCVSKRINYIGKSYTRKSFLCHWLNDIVMPVDKNKIRALSERVNKTSNADFVKRLLDRRRETIKNPDGTVSTHELGYVTEGDHAVVFPDIQSTENGLVRVPYPKSYERAVERGDTVHMSVPDARLFTEHYKEVYPGFDKYSCGGTMLRRFDLGGGKGPSGGGHSGGRGEATPEDFYRERMRGSDSKWERISNARYFMANDSLMRSGASPEDAERLARILGAQSALETGWVDDVKGNNFAGYMSNGKRMTFDNPSAFWDYHISNLDRKWPGWRDAKDITEYYNIVNHPDLGLDTKEKFDAYNRAHRDNPVYIYAPAWENGNYLRDLRSVYDRYINKYVNLDFSDGGGIHIDESHKGLFTAKAKRAGRSVQEQASHVLANKEDYSSRTIKQAAFAKAASKWHSDGGAINRAFDSGDLDLLRAAVNNVMKKKISGK